MEAGRRNLLFVVLFIAGAVLRLLVVLAYQPVLMLQKDTYIYLQTAVSSGNPSNFRPALYSLFFLKPLLIFDNLAIVPIVQHVAGLAISLILYVLLRRLAVPPVLAALGTAPLLLDGYQLDLEHYLLTETFFDILMVAAFILLAWKVRPSVPAVGLAGALLAMAGLTRFVGMTLIVPAALFVIFRRMGWLRFATLAVAFVIPLASYSLWFRSSSGTLGVTDRNGFFLYGRVASFADCSKLELRRELERFCFTEPPEERGPNYGVFALDVPPSKLQRIPNANAKLLQFSKSAIFGQPLDYVRVVVADFVRFLEATSPTDQEPYAKRWRFPRSLDDADPHPFVVKRKGSAPPNLGFEKFRIDRTRAEQLRTYQGILYTRGPILALLFVLGLIGAIVGLKVAEGRNLRAESILFVGSGLILLIVPVMTTVYHFRYVIPVLPVLGPAGALGATVISRRVRDRIDRFQSQRHESSRDAQPVPDP